MSDRSIPEDGRKPPNKEVAGTELRKSKCCCCMRKRPGWVDKSVEPPLFYCEPCWNEYEASLGKDGKDYDGKVWHDAILDEDNDGSDDDTDLVMKFTKHALTEMRANRAVDQNEEERDELRPLPQTFSKKTSDLLSNVSSELQRAHIMVVVDTSGSMRKLDVKPEEDGTTLVSRISAVTASLLAFFEKQNQSGSPYQFSLISFSETSQTHFVGWTAQLAVQYMMQGSNNFAARDGTHFVESLIAARHILNVRKDLVAATHLLIFSDGQPADGRQMIRSVQTMLREHPNLRIHAIGFGEGLDFEWLQQLTSIGRGTFAPSSRSIAALHQAFTSVTSTITQMQTVSSSSKSSTYSFRHAPEDKASNGLTFREVDFEQANQFVWNKGCSSFRSDRRWFRYNGKDFKQCSFQIRGSLVSMRLQPFMQGGMRLVYGFHDPSIPLQLDQFAAKSESDARMVAKISKYVDDSQNSSEIVSTYAKSSAVAAFYSRVFKLAALERLDTGRRMTKIVFLRCHVYKVEEKGKAIASFMVGERYLPGVFVKYNSNNGFVNTDAPDSEIAQAFSHFTFEASGGKQMVLDLQGVHLGTAQRDRPHLILTDPQVVSLERSFGPGDLGDKGMQAFFRTHQCGSTCKKMGLDQNAWHRMRKVARKSSAPASQAVGPALPASSNSGSISSLRTADSEASTAFPPNLSGPDSSIPEPEALATPSKPENPCIPTVVAPNPGRMENLPAARRVKPSSEVSTSLPSESPLALVEKPEGPLSAPVSRLKPRRPPDHCLEASTSSPPDAAVEARLVNRPPTALGAKPDGPLSAIMARSLADSKRPDYDSLLRGRRGEPEQPARSALQAPGRENGGTTADAGRKGSVSDVASPAKAPPPAFGLCYPNMVEGVEASRAKAPPPPLGPCYPNMVEGVEASRAKAPPPPLGPGYPNMVEGVEASRAKAPPPPLGPGYPNMVEGVEARPAKAPPFKAPPLKAPPAMGLGHPSAATTLAETTKQALGG